MPEQTVPRFKGWTSKELALKVMEKQGRPASEINQLAREWDEHIANHQKEAQTK